jgi:hypothetical protein
MSTLGDFGLINDAPDSILGQKAWRLGEFLTSREAIDAAKEFYLQHSTINPVIEKRGETYVILIKLDEAVGLGLIHEEQARAPACPSRK